MHPTRRLDDRSGLASGLVQLVVAATGIGLQDAVVAGEVPGGMLPADLSARLRCRECDARGRTVVSVKWRDERGKV
jgi:hypothetical protein